MSKKTHTGVSVGSSSLLVIIVVLCLVCFAGLSIVSASADMRLSQKLAERTTAYYHALDEANQQLAHLAKEKEPLKDSLTFSYSVSDTEALVLTVIPNTSDENASDELFISSLKLVTTKEPELDQSLPVFQ